MSEKYPRRKLAPGQRCEYEGCDRPATDIACGRMEYRDGLPPGHPDPGVYCDFHVAAVTALIVDLEAELQMAYENADFDEPLTFEEYRADLQEQATARAQYLAKRKGGGG